MPIYSHSISIRNSTDCAGILGDEDHSHKLLPIYGNQEMLDYPCEMLVSE